VFFFRRMMTIYWIEQKTNYVWGTPLSLWSRGVIIFKYLFFSAFVYFFGTGGPGFVAQLLSLVLGVALVSCAFYLEVVYYVCPNCAVNRSIKCERSLWDCAACLMHVLACAATGINVMTVSFSSWVYTGLWWKLCLIWTGTGIWQLWGNPFVVMLEPSTK
jgi:hypothetical protein